MKTKGLDGRTYSISLSQYTNNEKIGASEPHKRARKLLKKLYPFDPILEELYIPGNSSSLYADFYIASQRLMVEVHGEQHFRFIPFFHKTPQGFAESKKRDREKIDWCELNHIRIVILKDDENESIWEKRIRDE